VVGAVRDGVRFARAQVRIELNSATDNPVILLDVDGPNKAYSAGLFHGEPVGMAADHLKLSLCELAAIAERRVYRLTTGTLSSRLPPLLVQADRPGMGLMVPQTTAAALVSENRALAWPCSADSIPTCEDQEDHVAMATTAARRVVEVLANTRRVVAIELLAAAQALWWRQSDEPGVRLGRGTAAAVEAVEAMIGRGGECPSDDIEALAEGIASGRLGAAVTAQVGALHGVDDD
jgi:histidine ammonia-lyase